jgi:hypothetical protein
MPAEPVEAQGCFAVRKPVRGIASSIREGDMPSWKYSVDPQNRRDG